MLSFHIQSIFFVDNLHATLQTIDFGNEPRGRTLNVAYKQHPVLNCVLPYYNIFDNFIPI